MNYARGTIPIKKEDLLSPDGHIYMAGGFLIDLGRQVKDGRIFFKGKVCQGYVYFLGRCPDCGCIVKKKERVIFIKAYEFSEDPAEYIEPEIYYEGKIKKTDIISPDLEIITAKAGEMVFENYVKDPEQIIKDSIFLSEDMPVYIKGKIKSKNRIIQKKCLECASKTEIKETIQIIETEKIKINSQKMLAALKEG